ncbi:hypothetical protein [Phytoactinopolyspora endophytica]|uniref:hypothetical protein n=1 Tax=Phytoactinopolyspora endophytica TaxID=1642495 RepID=UPI00101C441D|nr:hypothetical protein [Phytoactinopolyspora endophytica]
MFCVPLGCVGLRWLVGAADAAGPGPHWTLDDTLDDASGHEQLWTSAAEATGLYGRAPRRGGAAAVDRLHYNATGVLGKLAFAAEG